MKRILLLSFSLPFLTSCAVYYPQIASVQLPSQKGDLDITGVSSPVSGFYSAASYSPLNHLAIQTQVNVGYCVYLGQAMVGYYQKLNKNLILADYLGASYQDTYVKISSAEFYTDTYIYGEYPVYFNQLNFGIKKEKIEVGTFFKLGYFSSAMTTKVVDDEYNKGVLSVYDKPFEGFAFENSYYIKTGKKNTKFLFVLGLSRFFKSYDFDYGISNLKFSFGLGMSYNINLKKKTPIVD